MGRSGGGRNGERKAKQLQTGGSHEKASRPSCSENFPVPRGGPGSPASERGGKPTQALGVEALQVITPGTARNTLTGSKAEPRAQGHG